MCFVRIVYTVYATERSRLWLLFEKLFVKTTFQRQGIGEALLEYLLRNTPANSLLVLEKNEGAIKLYTRYGFRLTEYRQKTGDTKDDLVRIERK